MDEKEIQTMSYQDINKFFMHLSFSFCISFLNFDASIYIGTIFDER